MGLWLMLYFSAGPYRLSIITGGILLDGWYHRIWITFLSCRWYCRVFELCVILRLRTISVLPSLRGSRAALPPVASLLWFRLSQHPFSGTLFVWNGSDASYGNRKRGMGLCSLQQHIARYGSSLFTQYVINKA